MAVDNETLIKKNKPLNTSKSDTTKLKSNDGTIPFDFYGKGTKWGVSAGVTLAMFLLALNFFGLGDNIGLKFLKYILLAGILAYGLVVYKKYMKDQFRFKKGILLGLYTTIISAISLVVMSLLFYAISDSLAFGKFQLEPDNLGDFAVIIGVLFFEVLVYGIIITFIILQFIKTKKRPY